MKFIYNDNDVNSMSFGSLHVNKVYYNGYVYQYAGIPDSGGQHPCFDVTDNISTYSSTTYDMVFDTTQEKWYMLNNLSEYEEYGIMGSGRNITTYEGKLTIDGDYEYEWNGGEWISVGAVTGGTSSLPDIPFTCNYNARDYNASTHTIPMTRGQLNNVDAVITGDTASVIDHHDDGYISITARTNGTRAIVSGTSSDYWNRTNSTPDLTIICKAKTTSSNGGIIVNRSGNYNWMFRQYSNKLTLHGTNETGSIAITTGVVTTCGVRVSSDRSFVYNNFTESTTSSGVNFSYGNTTTSGGCLFMGYSTTSSEQWNGDFYWVYFSQNTLTDAQVQQVIDFNEGGGITIPLDYEDLDAPVDNVVFSTMADALAYECPWIGMTATIAGEDYIFGDNDEWLEKYGLFEVTGEYLCNSGNKYKKMEEKVRNVDGTWSSQSPAVYEIGDLIEEGSEDCRSVDYTKKYLTFIPTSGNCTFTHDRTAVQYSLNSGTSWQTLATNGSVTVQQGQEIWWKANFTQGNNDYGNGTFTATNYFKAEGNLLSLIGGDNFESVTTIGNAIFGALFVNNTYLNDIDNLKIPASSYGTFAFRQTFRNSGIVTMPTDLLTASTIGNYCFYGGFEACANLVRTCEFNFTSIGSNGCGYMFQGCSNLSTVIDLSTTTGNRSNWLNGVASTGTFTKKAGVTWSSGKNGIPNGWTILER